MRVLGAREVMGRESGDSPVSSPSLRAPLLYDYRQTAGVESYSTRRYSLGKRVRPFGLENIGNTSIENGCK